jgi:uncharacterized C2H2 Zn-finger protein
MPDRFTAERIALNDSAFRAANEQIAAAAAEGDLDTEQLPFLCECAEPRCHEILRVRLDEYRHVRSSPRWFMTVPGHEEGPGSAAKLVENRDGYAIVEKQGHAGDVAEELADDGARL